MSSAAFASRGLTRLLSCAFAALLGGALYLNALHNPFVYDDARTVVDNGSIVSLRDVASIVLFDSTRPLTNFSFAVDRAIWGEAPFGFHLTSVLLHVLNVMLVFLITSRIWRDTRESQSQASDANDTLVATGAAVLFAVHPLMSEAVVYISSRSDLLCAAFSMLAFLAAQRWLRRGGALPFVLVWVLCFAALLAKETAAVLPLVVLAYSALCRPLASTRPRATTTLTGPLLVAMLIAAAVRLSIFAGIEGGHLDGGWHGVVAAGITFWDYVRLLCVPVGQTIFHPVATVSSAGDLRVWGSVALLVATGAVGWQQRTRRGVAVFGVAWCAVLLAPAVLFSAVDPAGTLAEHRAYLPAAGFFVSVSALLGETMPLVRRYRSTSLLAPLAFSAVVLMLGTRTYMRNLVWADPVNLWQEAASYAPSHWLPFEVLGESLHAGGRHAEAVDAYRTSMTLRPDNESGAVNLVVCLSELGRAAEANAAVDALEVIHPASAYIPIGRGTIAAIDGRAQPARLQFLEAIARDPGNVMARQWLAVLASETDDRAEMLRRCGELQRLAPGRLSIARCVELGQPFQ